MSRERFQSETGQTIDDNGSSFFGYASPLFYTVNPKSGISLRQQEQLGAPSILKSFRDLPGCTRLSSSLSNLDTTNLINKRAQYPLLPDINQKANMGKSLQGHHSSSKRYSRERYNPPFKVNAKIRHVYTQEVTTIEGSEQQSDPLPQPHHVACHRQTQTDPQLFPESKRQEVEQISDDKSNKNVGSMSRENDSVENEGEETDTRKVDAATSPIHSPTPYLPSDTMDPFAGCSQMNVYPPLNYVRKLEDLEKITGHIVIQRFFTRTDDAFGTWLERQLGMTSKSVSVDTSEFENAKMEEPQNENKGNDNAITIEPESRKEIEESNQEAIISGAVTNKDKNELSGEGQSCYNSNPNVAECNCALTDTIKCECYLKEICKSSEEKEPEKELMNEIEEQIIPTESTALGKTSDTLVQEISADDDEVETLMSSSVPKEESSPRPRKLETEEDIDEMVRCTLEAYLMAPMAYEELNIERQETAASSPFSIPKSEVDSGRADSIRSGPEKFGSEGHEDIEGNTSHDSVETVYEIPMPPPRNIELTDEIKVENEANRTLQRSLSADSCIGTESSGEKNPTTNASQSSNDTIEGLDPVFAHKELVDLNLALPASAPPTIPKLPSISASAKVMGLSKKMSSGKSQRSMTPNSATRLPENISRNEKVNAESEDADGESETESEITDHFVVSTKVKQDGGTDLELEEVDEYEGDEDDDRDAFETMVANHLKYSRGLPTATRRSRLNRSTQTTKSIEPSTTSGSASPCSSSNSSFDVEIISKSKRITTNATSGNSNNHEQAGVITPSNMTLAWHDGGRRRSYLPSSSSSLNLLNMKFSLGKDFESEVSIRMPSKSSTSANIASASTLLPSSSGGAGGKTLMSSCSRTHHHQHYQNRGLSPGGQSQHQNSTHQAPLQSVPNSASLIQPTPESTDLQSLWKDVRTKLDVQVDEMTAIIQDESPAIDLHVRGNSILPADSTTSGSGSTSTKLRRNEEKIKRSLQRLKKILDD